MHWTSMEIMRRKFEEYLDSSERIVADLGSKPVSFQPKYTYKALLKPKWIYIGIDLEEGENVDIVMPSEFSIPIDDESVDVLISGQCIEHCRNPFRLIKEGARIIRPGGFAFITAPACWPEHRFPIDCFRYYPDGMRSVLEEAGLIVLEAFLGGETPDVGGKNPIGIDCWGIASKPKI